MTRTLRLYAAVGAGLLALTIAHAAAAQKPGGILKSYSIDSPASMSIHEEATVFAVRPMMGVFNNLVLYDQHVKQNSIQSIVPELGKSWSWDEESGRKLTFKLEQGVKWHDGKPFTARDVKCTWDMLLGRANDKLRVNPRKAWYRNLEEVTTSGDHEVTFVLKQPQPAFLALLAVPAKDMRQHPIGTGPFKFVEYKPNEAIKLTRNPDYWKPGRPYLDGIEYTIIKNMSTAILTFASGKLDITFGGMTVPLERQVREQATQAICEMNPTNVGRNLLINRESPPFDNAELRKAMALALDRQAFIDIITEGKGNIGGIMLPPPEGVWGMPPEVLQALPGLRVAGGVKDSITGLPRVLSFVHGGICVDQQGIGPVFGGSAQSDPYTAGDEYLLLVHAEGGAQFLGNALGHQRSIPEIGYVLKQDGEFIPPDAGHRINNP